MSECYAMYPDLEAAQPRTRPTPPASSGTAWGQATRATRGAVDPCHAWQHRLRRLLTELGSLEWHRALTVLSRGSSKAIARRIVSERLRHTVVGVGDVEGEEGGENDLCKRECSSSCKEYVSRRRNRRRKTGMASV